MPDDLFDLGTSERLAEVELLVQKYRSVFTSPLGVEVLKDILVNHCHFLCFHEGGEDGAYNVGIKILSNMGIAVQGNQMSVINALISVTPPRKEGG